MGKIPQLNFENFINPINEIVSSMYLPVTTFECANIISNLKISHFGMNKMSSIMLIKVKDL